MHSSIFCFNALFLNSLLHHTPPPPRTAACLVSKPGIVPRTCAEVEYMSSSAARAHWLRFVLPSAVLPLPLLSSGVLMGTNAFNLVLPLHRYCCTAGSPRLFSPANAVRQVFGAQERSCSWLLCYALSCCCAHSAALVQPQLGARAKVYAVGAPSGCQARSLSLHSGTVAAQGKGKRACG